MARVTNCAPRTEGGTLPTEAARPQPTQLLEGSSLTWAPRPPSETVGPPASLALECGRSDPPWCCSNARRTDRGPGRCAPNPCCLRAPPSFPRGVAHGGCTPPVTRPCPSTGGAAIQGPDGDRRPCSFIFFSGKRTVWDPRMTPLPAFTWQVQRPVCMLLVAITLDPLDHRPLNVYVQGKLVGHYGCGFPRAHLGALKS